VSRSLREGLRGGEWPVEDKSEVIPNGIDGNVFRMGRNNSLREEIGLAENTLIMGAVGNVRLSKRYDLLLEAFAKVKAQRPTSQLVIIGQPGGPLFEELLRLRFGLGLEDSVHFLGFREDVPKLLQGMDLFVLSSSDEGFSLAIVQAMATGLPIVATRCGGPEEILDDGVHGRLVAVNDPGSLACGILEVLSFPDRGRRYGKAARERAISDFSIEAMVRRYEAVYRRSLVGRSGRVPG
jgi:glycosyltransferase involved in cell wall biosynthesis